MFSLGLSDRENRAESTPSYFCAMWERFAHSPSFCRSDEADEGYSIMKLLQHDCLFLKRYCNYSVVCLTLGFIYGILGCPLLIHRAGYPLGYACNPSPFYFPNTYILLQHCALYAFNKILGTAATFNQM